MQNEQYFLQFTGIEKLLASDSYITTQYIIDETDAMRLLMGK